MVRPRKQREISGAPCSNYFKPTGIPVSSLEKVTLSLDEFESIRLSDFLGLYHEEAAKEMNISRQTFGNIIKNARKKISDALINGKALEICKNE